MAMKTETKVFKLKVPLEYDGKEIAEITMRAPKVRDIIMAQKVKGSESDQTVAMFASISGVPMPAWHDMDLRDFRRIERWIGPFIGGSNSPEDGETTS